MDSILTSIKKLLGISEDDESFDQDIILHINSAIMFLNQLGVGSWIIVKDKTNIWSELIGDRADLESVKIYIYLKVRTIFDPPSNPSVLEALQRHINELEWRLNLQGETSSEGGILNG